MCGLIGIIAKPGEEEVNDRIINQYQDQIDRGRKGFGIIAVGKDEYKVKRAADEVKAIIDLHFMEKEHILLFHHRMPTSTDNKISQTHPIKVSHKELKYDWLIMHNGVISNDDKIKKMHEELGYVYTTLEFHEYKMSEGGLLKWNDSESFAVELVRHLEEKETAIRTKGSAAWIALRINKKTDKPISILWGTNGGNPLKMIAKGNCLTLASEINGEPDLTKDTAYEIQVKGIFGKNDLQSLISLKTINFTPLVEPEPEWRSSLRNHQIGFHTHNKREHFKEKKEIIPATTERDYDDEYEKWKLSDPRMAAFDKMHQRVAENINEDLEEFFISLAIEDIGDEIIDDHLDNIADYLLEAKNRAVKARSFFDGQEQKSYAQALSEDVAELTRIP